ncbi:MAG: hypothetical protein ACK5NY_07815, partial [Burkholderiaceae bacterium]
PAPILEHGNGAQRRLLRGRQVSGAGKFFGGFHFVFFVLIIVFWDFRLRESPYVVPLFLLGLIILIQ